MAVSELIPSVPRHLENIVTAAANWPTCYLPIQVPRLLFKGTAIGSTWRRRPSVRQNLQLHSARLAGVFLDALLAESDFERLLRLGRLVNSTECEADDFVMKQNLFARMVQRVE
jgi:hypothetical protein